MEGFLEAGPQLALQLSLLLQGSTSHSKRILWERHIGDYSLAISNETYDQDSDDVTTIASTNQQPYNASDDLIQPGSLQIFGRVYDEGK